MLDEYIMNQLNQVEDEFLRLNQALSDLNDQECNVQNKLKELLEKKDIGLEIFSPRIDGNLSNEEIEEMQRRLEELRIRQMEVSEQISRNREKEEKYQLLLNEARMKEISDTRELASEIKTETSEENEAEQNESDGDNKITVSSDVADDHYREDLQEILNRVEKCMNLVNHDRTRCKNELRNLKYYLKALLGHK